MANNDDEIWNGSPAYYHNRSPPDPCKSHRTDTYRKYHEIQADSSSDTLKKYQELTHMILLLLCTVSFEDRFFFNKVPEIIERCADEDKNFDAEKASKALRQLERYVLLIARSPWKQEFKSIKLYNGFFRVKVQVHLSKAIDLLGIIGFERTTEDTIQLSNSVNSDMCYKVAFDLFVASVECEMLATAFRKLVPRGFVPGDIVKSRRHTQGDVDSLVNYVLKNCKVVPLQLSDKSSGHEPVTNEEAATGLPRGQHMLTRPQPERRGIDKITGAVEKLRTDSGYQTESATSLVHRSGRSRYTPDHYDSPPEFAPPGYHVGTMDDHLNAASVITAIPRSPATVKKPLKSTMSLGNYEQKAGAEWDYVRHGLIEKFGPAYYQGERGDILQPRSRTPIPSHVKGGYFKERSTEPAPELPPRGESAPRLPPRPYIPAVSDYTERLRQEVAYPPPLVSRGTKPVSRPLTRQYEQCDGGASLETDSTPERQLSAEVMPRRKSSSDKLFDGPSESAASKSAIFKDKLQRYERLEQQLNVPRDSPNYDSNSWECRTCTFRNESRDTICEACGRSAREAPDMNYQTYARICSHCTFENEPGATVCVMCESHLDNFQTVV